MSRLVWIRLVTAAIGIVVWGYGLQQDDDRVRLVGIIVIAASLVLRFVPRRLRRDEDGTS